MGAAVHLLHVADADAFAAKLTAALRAAGHEVVADASRAEVVLVLWSREGVASPPLLAAAEDAIAKLVSIEIDGQAPELFFEAPVLALEGWSGAVDDPRYVTLLKAIGDRSPEGALGRRRLRWIGWGIPLGTVAAVVAIVVGVLQLPKVVSDLFDLMDRGSPAGHEQKKPENPPLPPRAAASDPAGPTDGATLLDGKTAEPVVISERSGGAGVALPPTCRPKGVALKSALRELGPAAGRADIRVCVNGGSCRPGPVQLGDTVTFVVESKVSGRVIVIDVDENGNEERLVPREGRQAYVAPGRPLALTPEEIGYVTGAIEAEKGCLLVMVAPEGGKAAAYVVDEVARTKGFGEAPASRMRDFAGEARRKDAGLGGWAFGWRTYEVVE